MTDLPLWAVGHLTVDDVVLPDGTTKMRQVGGAPVYAAAAARMAGTPAGVVTAMAPTLPEEVTAWMTRERLPIVNCGRTERYISQWALYEYTGRRVFVHHPDSAGLDEAAPDPRAWTARPGCGWAHIAPMPVALQAGWLRTLTAQGMRVTLDPHEDSSTDEPERVLEMLPRLSAFLPSEQEAAAIFGGDMHVAAARFVAAGARLCVVKLGQDGCLVATADGIWRVPSVAVKPVDVTGAGDAFCGAFAAALASGADPEYAARCGTVAASYTIEHFGVPSSRGGTPGDWAARMATARPTRCAA